MSYPEFITNASTSAFIASDKLGNLYVPSTDGNTVTKYGPDGVQIGSGPLITGLSSPYAVAFDSADNLYVTQVNGTIRKYTSTGVEIGTNPFISGLSSPQGLAFDSVDNLYVVGNGDGIIKKYGPNGVQIGSGPLISGLTNAHGITIDSADNLYVSHNNSIQKFTSSGVQTGQVPFISGLNNPHGMDFDFFGDLYVANLGDSKIAKYNSNGGLIDANLITSGISTPQGLDIDLYGNLYVSRISHPKIGKFLVAAPPAPTISSIFPISGLILGGESVTIEGNNFIRNITTVKFGSAFATSVNVNSSRTSMTCITPNGSTGTVNVVVTTSGGEATLTNGFSYVAPPAPISNICFPVGTPITTNQGTFPIEKINTEIHTIRNKKIVGITQTITQDKYLVCFEKDSLGINLPSQKTIISKNHGIFYKGKMLHAKEFIGKFENVKKIKYTGEILYNVLMEEDDKMMVNSLICETLHPENGIAKLYKCLQNLNPKEQQNLIEEYNEYAIKNKVFSSKKITK